MKNRLKKIKLLSAILPVVIILSSCEYQSVADAIYPDQTIYMAASKSGVYTIDNVSTDNAPFRYEMDSTNNKILIPLGIYRSGINNKGDISVDIKINNDTVLKLISAGGLIGSDNSTVDILPSDKYVLPATVQVKNGNENAVVQLVIDIPFLLANPGKRFALGITISSNNVKTSPNLNTTIVLINTNFIFPKANFSFVVDSQDSTKAIFTNTSLFGIKYKWDFGDGSPVFIGNTPPAHKYDSLGIYNLKLTVQGVTGSIVTLDSIVHLWKNVTKIYFPNPGNPFIRSDNRAVKTGNLKDWSWTANVQSGGYGGFYADLIPVMDFFSTLPLSNAKIFRSFDLPQGIYKSGFVNAGFKGSNDCYYMVALGDSLPNVEAIPNNSNVLASYHWNTDISTSTNEIYFELKSTQRVTIGFLVNNTAKSEVKIKSVFLYR
jgi:PKD repeat protein